MSEIKSENTQKKAVQLAKYVFAHINEAIILKTTIAKFNQLATLFIPVEWKLCLKTKHTITNV